MRDDRAPERLLGSQYLEKNESYRIFKQDVNGRIHTHWHDFFELGYILSGKGVHMVNGEPFPLGRGMVFLLTTADFHEIVPDEGETIHLYNMIFKDSWVMPELAEKMFEREAPHVYTLYDEDAERMRREFSGIWEESREERFGKEWLVRGSLERVLILLTRRCLPTAGISTARDSASDRHPSIRKALVYLQHHFREPVSLGSIAAYAGMSANYFSECFHKQTGISFQEFVSEKRLLFASALLGSTRLAITEICYASGFNTIPHFEKSFKRKYGLSPRDYRKRIGSDGR
ncbi:AraC family transcriptional regulator [Paenibacillus agaridevorans]|uniref:AraC family transcriptional regulator n=1 Tax=Paenibacillus agaridevorans TaxID=171404 RepID=UPI001BE4CD5F|nr:AraC family transcriptional regulator [Paenibacillus agaridevorans]